MIPRVVVQTWEDKTPERWSGRRRRWLRSWQDKSGWTHELFDAGDRRALIAERHPELAAAFAALRPVEQADVWRVAHLLAHGGLYVDLDTVCRAPVDRWIGQGDELVVGLLSDHLDRYPDWRPRHVLRSGGVFDPESPWRDNLVLFANGVIAARPGHPLLADTLRRIAINLDDPFFVAEDVGLICKRTGPGVLTDAIDAHLARHGTTLAEVGRQLRREPELRVGDVRLLDYASIHGRYLQHIGMRTWEPRRGLGWLVQRVWEELV